MVYTARKSRGRSALDTIPVDLTGLLTVNQFCLKHDLSRATLYAWIAGGSKKRGPAPERVKLLGRTFIRERS
jgi:hypothetical protein